MAAKKQPIASLKNSLSEDPGLAEIDAWGQWFIRVHEERLSREHEFPDRHLVETERAKVAAQATAMVERMKSDYLGRQR